MKIQSSCFEIQIIAWILMHKEYLKNHIFTFIFPFELSSILSLMDLGFFIIDFGE